jgi:D-3-phosphoglycerate dehydrogenase
MGFKVVAQLPAHIPVGEVEDRYAWELEALHAIDAKICEVAAASEDEFVRFAHDADALITSWGFQITRRIIEGLQRCVVIGVGSVGVDTVDVDAATEAGIVVTNTPTSSSKKSPIMRSH